MARIAPSFIGTSYWRPVRLSVIVSELRFVSTAVGTPATDVDFVEPMSFSPRTWRGQPRGASNNASDFTNVHQSAWLAERDSVRDLLRFGGEFLDAYGQRSR